MAILGVIATIPQKSVEPLLINAPVIFAAPPLLRNTVAFRQLATGGRVSTTVTMGKQLLIFPFTSVARPVTVLGPMLEQEKELGLTVKLRIPQASDAELIIWEGIRFPNPEGFS